MKQIAIFLLILSACGQHNNYQTSENKSILVGSKQESRLYYFSNGLLVRKACRNITVDSDIDRNCVHERSVGFKYVYELSNSYMDTGTRRIDDQMRIDIRRLLEVRDRIDSILDTEDTTPPEFKAQLDKAQAEVIKQERILDSLSQEIADLKADLANRDDKELSNQLVKTKENYFKTKATLDAANANYSKVKHDLIDALSNNIDDIQFKLLHSEAKSYEKSIATSRALLQKNFQERIFAEQLFKMILDNNMTRILNDFCDENDSENICAKTSVVLKHIDRAMDGR